MSSSESLRVAHCIPADGPTIGSLETSTVSRFLQLQLGTATLESLKNWLAEHYSIKLSRAQTLEDEPAQVFLKVVNQDANDNDEGAVISFADWELPDDDDAPKTGGGANVPLPPGMNLAFYGEASFQMREMRKRVLHGRKCFMLSHLSTFPSHQRRGAATLLVTWPFEQADREGIVCYLTSQADGQGVKLYERLGFQKVDECHVDLTMCGLEGMYTHVAMVREPKRLAAGENIIGKLEEK